jgi:hypothetical protein
MNTISNGIRAFYKINNLSPPNRRFGEDEMFEKFLSCFTPGINAALSYAAITELTASKAERLFQRSAVGGRPSCRDIHSLQAKWEPQWRLLFVPARSPS